ncbi:MAG: serine--tRNA ligase, partial [Dehalococcoidia bacterium]|nr:serine--tRNA ligase [Dehalococcoidia bacterium]
MLAIQTIRDETDRLRAALEARRTSAPVDEILAADESRRSLLVQVESMRKDRNDASKAIGTAKDNDERQRLIEAQRAVSGKLDALEAELKEAETSLDRLLLQVPNLPHPEVPVGGEED